MLPPWQPTTLHLRVRILRVVYQSSLNGCGRHRAFPLCANSIPGGTPSGLSGSFRARQRPDEEAEVRSIHPTSRRKTIGKPYGAQHAVVAVVVASNRGAQVHVLYIYIYII